MGRAVKLQFGFKPNAGRSAGRRRQARAAFRQSAVNCLSTSPDFRNRCSGLIRRPRVCAKNLSVAVPPPTRDRTRTSIVWACWFVRKPVTAASHSTSLSRGCSRRQAPRVAVNTALAGLQPDLRSAAGRSRSCRHPIAADPSPDQRQRQSGLLEAPLDFEIHAEGTALVATIHTRAVVAQLRFE